MPDYNVNPTTDELRLLVDIAASLRILAGRAPIKFDGQFPAIPEEVAPAIKPEAPAALPLTLPEPPKPAKVGRPPKTKTGDGGGD